MDIRGAVSEMKHADTQPHIVRSLYFLHFVENAAYQMECLQETIRVMKEFYITAAH
jgi:hypothetical protein